MGGLACKIQFFGKHESLQRKFVFCLNKDRKEPAGMRA